METLRTGSLGTLHALELARAHGARIVVVSSSEVYGDPQVHPQPEDYRGNVDPIGPRSCYDEAKRFAEAAAVAYRRVHEVDAGIVRPFNIYGPGMWPGDGRVVPEFCAAALRGQTLHLHNGGTQTRSLLYVDDAVNGLLRLLDSDVFGPINLGSEDEITIRALAKTIVELAGSGDLDIAPGRNQDVTVTVTGTVRFVLPANWRVVAGMDALGELTCEAGTAGAALTWLAETYPAFRERVFTSDGQLVSWMVVCLDDEDIRHHAGLDTPITPEHRELRVITALMGG
ncbi:MAG: NAD-dependent epimerase/dehydratase family protein [Pseudonocardiaceae bacterium]